MKISNALSLEAIIDIQNKIFFKVFCSNMQLLTSKVMTSGAKIKTLNTHNSRANSDINIKIFCQLCRSNVQLPVVSFSCYKEVKSYIFEHFCRKKLAWISIIASKLRAFVIFDLTYEVKFDLGGQTSF